MRDPQALMSTADLASLLGSRAFASTTARPISRRRRPERRPVTSPYPDVGTFEEAHIPGADFLDLQGEFSDSTTRLRFMMPATVELERPSAVTGSPETVASCSTASRR